MPNLHLEDKETTNNDALERMRAVLEGALRGGEYECDDDYHDDDDDDYHDNDEIDPPNLFGWLEQFPHLLTRTNAQGETLFHIACDDLVPVAPSILLRWIQTAPPAMLSHALAHPTPVSFYTPLHVALESSMESRVVLRALMQACPQAVGKLDWSHETALHKLWLHYYPSPTTMVGSTKQPQQPGAGQQPGPDDNNNKNEEDDDDLFSIPFLETIVNSNPDILNAISDDDGTLLHICCKHQAPQMVDAPLVRWLIHHPSVGGPSAALLRPNRQGQSPLETAIRHGHPMVPELLRLTSRELWPSLLSLPARRNNNNHHHHNNHNTTTTTTTTKMDATGGGSGETTLLHHAARWCVQQEEWLDHDNHPDNPNNEGDNHETLWQFMSLFPATAWLQVDRHGQCPLFTARQAYQQRYQHHQLQHHHPTQNQTNHNQHHHQHHHRQQRYHRQWLRWMQMQTIHAASALLDCLADHPRVSMVAPDGRPLINTTKQSSLAPSHRDELICHAPQEMTAATLVGSHRRMLVQQHPGRTSWLTRNELQTLIQPVGVQQLLTDPRVVALLDGIVAMQRAAGRPLSSFSCWRVPSSTRRLAVETDDCDDAGLDILAAVRDNPSCLWLHLVEHPCLLKRRKRSQQRAQA